MVAKLCKIIIVVVVVVVVVVAVSLGVYFGVKKDSDDDVTMTTEAYQATTGNPARDTAPVFKVDGAWSDWDSWSECTATCGGGIETRSRSCIDPAPEYDGKDCVGKGNQQRACNEYECPNCNKTCPSGVELNKACTYCNCSGTSYNGTVLSTRGGPIADVRVYVVGQEWEPLVITDRAGKFMVTDDLCPDANLTFKVEGFATKTKTAGSIATVQLEPIELPHFITNPNNTAAFVGDSVTFVCMAIGNPDPSEYEWFKDGDVLEDEEFNTITFDNLASGEAGAYQCRASSTAGKTFSKKATLIVSENSEDTCDADPVPHMTSIDAPCTTQDGAAQVDVGRCKDERCRLRNPTGEEEDEMCCGPTETETIDVLCDGEVSYTLSRVTVCGCTECAVTDEIVLEVTVVETLAAVDEDTTPTQTPVEGIEVHVMGQMNITDDMGQVTFQLLPDAASFSVNVRSSASQDYSSQVTVIHVEEGTTEYEDTVIVTHRPTPRKVNASEPQTLAVTGNSDQPPAADIVMPANAIFDETGNPIEGDVNVFLTFSDPRDESSFSSVPGEFTSQNDEGQTRQLETYGVIGMEIETEDNQTAYFSGTLDIDVNNEELGIKDGDDGKPEAMLWTLDEHGEWKESGKLEHSSGARANRFKRQSNSGSSAATKIPTGVPYVNIDKPLYRNRQCHVAVYVYTDDSLVEGQSGQEVRIYTKSGGRYLGYSISYSDHNGRLCMNVACGYEHEIIVMQRGGKVKATEEHHLPDGWTFRNSHQNTKITFDTDDISSITDGYGPIHRYTSRTCYYSSSDQYHFQFHLVGGKWPGKHSPVETLPGRKLSWFNKWMHPYYTWYTPYKACSITVKLRHLDGYNDYTDQRIIARSYFDSNREESYGSFNGRFQPVHWWYNNGDEYACLLVKCPGDIVTGNTLYERQPTYVILTLPNSETLQCRFKQTNQEKMGDANEDNFMAENLYVFNNSTFMPDDGSGSGEVPTSTPAWENPTTQIDVQDTTNTTNTTTTTTTTTTTPAWVNPTTQEEQSDQEIMFESVTNRKVEFSFHDINPSCPWCSHNAGINVYTSHSRLWAKTYALRYCNAYNPFMEIECGF